MWTAYLVGVASGVICVWLALLVYAVWPGRELLVVRRDMPPGTRAQLERAARANRADLTRVRQPIPAMFVSPAAGDFDSEETR